jgi:hypothetical protein
VFSKSTKETKESQVKGEPIYHQKVYIVGMGKDLDKRDFSSSL